MQAFVIPESKLRYFALLKGNGHGQTGVATLTIGPFFRHALTAFQLPACWH
jgi:hypothetical protein